MATLLSAQYPQVRTDNPKRLIDDAMANAEIDEPGARDALVRLKLQIMRSSAMSGVCRLAPEYGMAKPAECR